MSNRIITARGTELLRRLELELPIIHAPMAGVSTPAMAAAASDAGALGSMGIGASNVAGAEKMIREARELSRRALNINVFCHQPAAADAAGESAWIERLRPHYVRLGAEPPAALHEIYTSFRVDDGMLELLLKLRPEVVSFHFGLPAGERLQALRKVACWLPR